MLFEKKEVFVYKDDKKKHKLDKDLNKIAVVEFLGTFTPRRSASLEKYEERAKQYGKTLVSSSSTTPPTRDLTVSI